MKKKLFTAFMLIVLMLAVLGGCAKSGINGTISDFEDACQELDTKAMLACINPSIADPILKTMDFLGVEDGSGILTALDSIIGIFSDEEEMTTELVKSIELSPTAYEFNEAKDECAVSAEMSYGDGNSRDITLQMILIEEVWYIGDIDF